ncbi:MAG: hypothetical protein Q9211_001687 [Gyalolechia sp. 1 TL-2023]
MNHETSSTVLAFPTFRPINSAGPRFQTPRQSPAKASSKPALPPTDKHERTRPKTTKARPTITGARMGKRATPTSTSRKSPRKPARKSAHKTHVRAAVRLICVLVKNRFGMESEVLCSPSESIGYFKTCLAFNIGIRPERVLLKQRGRGPLQDALTLEEYGVGEGSTLDLEIDAPERCLTTLSSHLQLQKGKV